MGVLRSRSIDCEPGTGSIGSDPKLWSTVARWSGTLYKGLRCCMKMFERVLQCINHKSKIIIFLRSDLYNDRRLSSVRFEEISSAYENCHTLVLPSCSGISVMPVS